MKKTHLLLYKKTLTNPKHTQGCKESLDKLAGSSAGGSGRRIYSFRARFKTTGVANSQSNVIFMKAVSSYLISPIP